MSGIAATLDKKKVQDYLKLSQKIDELLAQKQALESEFEAYVNDTGEVTLCNLLKVSMSKNPPKLVTTTEGGKVTDEMRQNLVTLLGNTSFVKTTIGLVVKKIHDAKESDKVVKSALKKVGLSTIQDEKMGFDKIVKSSKK
jgi:hypothetical protein